MTKQYIQGKDTKKHVNTALKAVFPGVKFSIRSDFDSVTVYWTDGPIKEDVEKVLNRFQSYTWIRAKDDRHEATGYEWEGTVFVGARYLSACRSLTNERRAALEAHFEEEGRSYGDANPRERSEAERYLVREGKLEGVPLKDRPDLMRDSRPVIDMREKEKQASLLAVEDLDRKAAEIEKEREELHRIGSSLQLIHGDVVKMSQALDAKIVDYSAMKMKLKKQQKPLA